jgi:hypothetical protein
MPYIGITHISGRQLYVFQAFQAPHKSKNRHLPCKSDYKSNWNGEISLFAVEKTTGYAVASQFKFLLITDRDCPMRFFMRE